MGNPSLCPAIWFSGFFGLAAVVHVIRLIRQFSIVLNGREIPMSASVIIAVVSAALSIGLLILGCKKPCCDKK